MGNSIENKSKTSLKKKLEKSKNNIIFRLNLFELLFGQTHFE